MQQSRGWQNPKEEPTLLQFLTMKALELVDGMEDMEPLKKNGRLSGLAALVVTALNIRPVMAGDHGVIVRIGQARGIEKALKAMVKHALENGTNLAEKTLGITHVNCRERAEWVCRLLTEKAAV